MKGNIDFGAVTLGVNGVLVILRSSFFSIRSPLITFFLRLAPSKYLKIQSEIIKNDMNDKGAKGAKGATIYTYTLLLITSCNQ